MYSSQNQPCAATMGHCSVCTRQKVVYEWGRLGNGRELKETLRRCLEINKDYMLLGSWSVTAGLAAYDDHVGGSALVPACALSKRKHRQNGPCCCIRAVASRESCPTTDMEDERVEWSFVGCKEGRLKRV